MPQLEEELIAPSSSYSQIKESLIQLYLEDSRPWLVGFSGGKDSTMLASLIFDAVMGVPTEERTKRIAVLCTDTRVEIPAVADTIEGTLNRMRRFSEKEGLDIEVNLLKPPPEQSFWVNIIGRGYPPPNRIFRWCTQRMKIDPVSSFVQKRVGVWGDAILHLGARRAESSTRAQAMALSPWRRKFPPIPCGVFWEKWKNSPRATAPLVCPTNSSGFSGTIWKSRKS